MRYRTKPTGLRAAACDRHLAKHMRDVCPPNDHNTETHVNVRRLDTPEPDKRCSCGAVATFFLRTLEVIR